MLFPYIQTCLQCFKRNGFSINPPHKCLPDPYIRHYVKQNFISCRIKLFFTFLCPREHRQIPVKTNHMSSVSSYFKNTRLPHSTSHCAIKKKQRINRKKYAPKPKIMDIECYVVVITTSEENVPIGRKALTCTSIQRY